MSGGNCPETPRQKMIGMMYLMLTAMLALNVSGDLLNAYLLVDKSILQAKANIERKNLLTYNQFENAYVLNKQKVEKSWSDAQIIQKNAAELVDHIYELKKLFVLKADGPEYTPEHYVSIKNQDIAAQIMIVEKLGDRSKELKQKITDYRDLLISYVEAEDTALIKNIERALSVEPTVSEHSKKNHNVSWESEKFEHIPLAASMALLSQIMSTTRNLEADVVNYLYSKIDEASFKFNKIEPLVIPKSTYIIAGTEYYAQIMMAARDTTQPPTISVINRNVESDASGVGILKIPSSTSSVGVQTWKGELAIKKPDGTDQTFPIAGEYIVAPPSVVVSPTQMNVFYEGIENPIEVSVPGVASENVRINVSSNANLTKKGNQWLVTPKSGTVGTKCEISVVAKMDNKDTNMGSKTFRIKRVPPPVAKVGTMTEGKISKSLLIANGGVRAEMEDFDFEGISWKVISFKISAVKGGYLTEESSTSPLFTKAQQDLINASARGQKIVIEDVRAEGPGGVKRNLNSIILTID